MFPVLELDGEPFAQGMACGRAARTQIGGSVRCYAAMFASCGIDWIDKHSSERQSSATSSEGCGGGIIEEIEGSAAGSG